MSSTKPKPPRHSYLTRKNIERIEAAYENALCDVASATDGNGDIVRLLSVTGVPTAQEMKEETFRFMENFDINAMYIKCDSAGKLVESQQSEIAAWTNLALLARATAAAIQHEAAHAAATAR